MDIKNIVSPHGDNIQVASAKKTAKTNQSARVDQSADNFVQSSDIKDEASREVKNLQQPDMERAVTDINKFFQAEKRRLSFTVNQSTRDLVIEVRDVETDEVVRQIPPEYVVKLAEHLQEMTNESGEAKMASGLLFKYKT